MQLNLSGHHVDVTPALKKYVAAKLERLERHFDHVTVANVVLSVEKLDKKAEATINISGGQLFADALRSRHVRRHRRPGRQAGQPDPPPQGENLQPPPRREPGQILKPGPGLHDGHADGAYAVGVTCYMLGAPCRSPRAFRGARRQVIGAHAL